MTATTAPLTGTIVPVALATEEKVHGMSRRTALLIGLTCCVLAVWMLGGCGGSHDSATSATASASSETATTADSSASDRYIVGLKQANQVSTQAAVSSLGGEVRHKYHLIPAMATRLTAQAAVELASDPNVSYVVPDVRVTALAQTTPWGITRVGAPTVFGAGNTGAGVKVAVIDSGIDYTHPDLAANYAGGYNFVAGTASPMDDNGHGTHVSGTIAAINNTIGVVGAAPGVSLYALKVLDASGGGYFSDVIAALQWCVDNNMRIASMSFGATGNPGTPVQAACDSAYAANVLLVAAAGNSGNGSGSGDNVCYPAKYSSVIAVTATDSSNVRASFSSTGSTAELAAPGVSVQSTVPGGGYSSSWSGTSMACPHVSGVAALVIASGVTSASAVRTRLQQTAVDLGASGRDPLYGYGLVNAVSAVAGGGTPTTGTIAGTVTNASTGQAVGSATVVTDTGQSAVASSSGVYTITGVTAGSRQVTASATGYTAQSKSVQVTAGGTATLSFTLTPQSTAPTAITGTVTSASTRLPITGATVTLDTGQSIKTSATGQYSFTSVRTGSRRVTAAATGYRTQTKTVRVSSGLTYTVSFALLRR